MKVAWEILKALKLRERGPDLIACPTCGRLQFDMDTVVAEVERRLEAYEDPIEVSVLGCAVNGIGEARHADFGITGAKDMGMIYSKGEPLKKVPTEQLVDELFKEIDRYYAAGKTVQRDETAAAEARAWLAENEDETAMTPERIAALEAAAARERRARRRGARVDARAADRRAPDGGARRGRLAAGRPALHPQLSPPAGSAVSDPARCLAGASRRSAAGRRSASSAGAAKPLGDLGPVDDVPPRVDVVGAAVLVLQVVGVLPHVDAQQRSLAGRRSGCPGWPCPRSPSPSRRARARTSPSRTG